MIRLISSVIEAARTRADQENSSRNSDTAILGWIQHSIGYLNSIVANGDNDHYLQDLTATASGVNAITLPGEVHQVRGVDWQSNDGRWVSVEPFSFQQRNSQQNGLALGDTVSPYQWRLYGTAGGDWQMMQIIPQPTAGESFRIWYTPAFEIAATDTFNFFNDWDEFVIVDVAIKMKERDEEDVSVLVMERQRLEERIRTDSRRRNTTGPETARDVSGYLGDDWWGRH